MSPAKSRGARGDWYAELATLTGLDAGGRDRDGVAPGVDDGLGGSPWVMWKADAAGRGEPPSRGRRKFNIDCGSTRRPAAL